uniref:Hint domain-containing protein n=1 Tax=Panagrolaimus superbus TaxID=310955 RepID=A0A914ZGB7_9BILA
MDRLNADMVYAEDISPDQCLFVLKDGIDFVETRISKIEIVKEKGIYAPMTHNGNLVANKIFASCFNIINNSNMQLSLSQNLRDFANSAWAKLWMNESSNDVTEIELIPGLQILVDLLKLILPYKM